MATLYGGIGADTINGTWDVDRIFGGPVISGNGNYYTILDIGADWIDAGGGDDVIWSANGNDTVVGGTGSDYIVGGAGDDVLYGDRVVNIFGNTYAVEGYSDGSDTIFGGAGNDLIYAQGASLYASSPRNLIYGGTGDDTIHGGRDADKIYGGDGNDLIHAGDDDKLTVNGSLSNRVYGDAGNDTLTGAGSLSGGPGDDLIQVWSGRGGGGGGDGNDTLEIVGETENFGEAVTSLNGGPGDDTLTGNSVGTLFRISGGQDVLTGGGGDDLFHVRYRTARNEEGVSRITDFVRNEDWLHFDFQHGSSKPPVAYEDNTPITTLDTNGDGWLSGADKGWSLVDGDLWFRTEGPDIVFENLGWLWASDATLVI